MTITTRLRLRTGAALSAAGLIALGTAGCASGVLGAAATHSAGSTPKQTVLTGTRLNALLLPASAVPAGLHLETDGTRNTGESVAPVSSAPIKPGDQCRTLLQTSWIRVAGIGSATFAQNDYVDAGHTNEFAQEIDVFHPGEAARVMTALHRTFTACRSFVQHSDGMVFKVRLRPGTVRGAGDEAVKATVTSSAWDGGMTLVAVRQGDAVVTAFYSSSHHDKGAAAVKMATTMAGNVRAAS